MTIELDRLEQRIVGVLIEKEMTVPDIYPLSLNALVTGCNQKNNRDPEMQVEDYEVEGALRALMDKEWVTRREGLTSRVHKYAHETRTQLGVDAADLAILCELLCRGPQAPGALKTRCARLHAFATPEDVEARLRAMAARPVPYVEELARQPRERQARWRHLLGRDAGAPAASAPEPAAPPARPAAPYASASPAPAPAVAAPGAAGVEELLERLEALEEQVADLRERLDRLEGR